MLTWSLLLSVHDYIIIQSGLRLIQTISGKNIDTSDKSIRFRNVENRLYSLPTHVDKHQLYLLEIHSESFDFWTAHMRINTEGKSLVMNVGPAVLRIAMQYNFLKYFAIISWIIEHHQLQKGYYKYKHKSTSTRSNIFNIIDNTKTHWALFGKRITKSVTDMSWKHIPKNISPKNILQQIVGLKWVRIKHEYLLSHSVVKVNDPPVMSVLLTMLRMHSY